MQQSKKKWKKKIKQERKSIQRQEIDPVSNLKAREYQNFIIINPPG